jgi:hypothetical protein
MPKSQAKMSGHEKAAPPEGNAAKPKRPPRDYFIMPAFWAIM